MAIEKVKLMTWAISDMEDLVTKRPRLAVALLQFLANRNADFTSRIESFATENIERRLARSSFVSPSGWAAWRATDPCG